jgi:hypothetical protein
MASISPLKQKLLRISAIADQARLVGARSKDEITQTLADMDDDDLESFADQISSLTADLGDKPKKKKKEKKKPKPVLVGYYKKIFCCNAMITHISWFSFLHRLLAWTYPNSITSSSLSLLERWGISHTGSKT